MSTKNSHSQASDAPFSTFYSACHNNDVEIVAALLPKLSLNDIDRVESNGSTALHVASYYGYRRIVKMLLASGATRTIRNRHGSTPYEEARTDEIRALFDAPQTTRPERKGRYVCESNAEYEWIFVDGDPSSYALFNRDSLLKCNGKSDFIRLTRGIREQYINESGPLADERLIDEVRTDFDKAIANNDPTRLVRAYTRETGFYSRLNRDLSLMPTHWSGTRHERNFVSILMFHPVFDEERRFTGVTYRGMTISPKDFQKYKVGGVFMNKTLLSTSKAPTQAGEFLQRNKASNELKVVCTYRIMNAGTALDIENLSVLPHEREVVILPYAAFRVRSIREPTETYGGAIEIDMSEEEDYQVAWRKQDSPPSSSSHTQISMHRSSHSHSSMHQSTSIKSSSTGRDTRMIQNAARKSVIDADDAFAQMWSDARKSRVRPTSVMKWQQQLGDHHDSDSDGGDHKVSVFSASNQQSHASTKTYSSRKTLDWKKFTEDDSEDGGF